MRDALLLLHLDHAHAARLLDLIEHQFGGGVDPDLDLLEEIVSYFLEYPDQCHHPVEDAVFRRVAQRSPEKAKKLEPMLSEHEQIGQSTRRFAALIERAREDSGVRDGELPEHAAGFVRLYREHMEQEEASFFPLAEASMTDEDWDVVAFDLFDSEDPLHDGQAQSRFRTLRHQIDRHSKQSLARATLLREARQLKEMVDVASFNSAMTRRRRPYSIDRREGGGYSLRARDDVLVDIPPCSEERAAWCAWFYVKSTPSLHLD